MELTTIQIGMFEMLAIVILAIYLGQWIREHFPILKKYCIPAPVVGGTLLSIITCILYMMDIVTFEWENYTVMNNFFYNLFFAASGTAASLKLLKKGGKLVLIFSILAAVLAVIQNAAALGLGIAMDMNPLTALMAGSTPLTGGHGNAASFGPIAAEMGGVGALEVAIASATFGLISGSIIGGPIGRQLIRKYNLDKNYVEETNDSFSEKISFAFSSERSKTAWFILLLACGLGQLLLQIRQFILPNVNIPIHVMCMLGGIIARFILDKTNNGDEAMY